MRSPTPDGIGRGTYGAQGARPRPGEPGIRPSSVWQSHAMRSVVVSYSWVPVGQVALDDRGRPVFPSLEAVDRWGLYRLVFTAEPRLVYIGETGRGLRRRWRDYELGAGKSTASRMHARLIERLASREVVDVEHVADLTISIRGKAVNAEAMPQPFVRRLVENAALLQDYAAGTTLINGVGYSTAVDSAIEEPNAR